MEGVNHLLFFLFFLSLSLLPLQIKARRGQKVKELSCLNGEFNGNTYQSDLLNSFSTPFLRSPPRGLFSSRFPPPCLSSLSLRPLTPLPQFSSGVGCASIPASFWHQAKRLQGLPWSEHREGEVARFLKDEKGKMGNFPRENSKIKR